MDLGATALDLFGVKVPAHMDGRPLAVAEAVAPHGNQMGHYRSIRPIVGARLYLDDDLRWRRTKSARRFWAKGERFRGPVVVSSTIGMLEPKPNAPRTKKPKK